MEEKTHEGETPASKTYINITVLSEYVRLIAKVMTPEQRQEFGDYLRNHPTTMTTDKNGHKHLDAEGVSHFAEIANSLKRYTSEAAYTAQVPPLFTKYTSENAAFAQLYGEMWQEKAPSRESVNAAMREFQVTAARSKAVMKIEQMDDAALETYFSGLPESVRKQFPEMSKKLLVAQDIEDGILLNYKEEQRATTTPIMKATGMENILQALADGSLTTEQLRKVLKHIDTPKKLTHYDQTISFASETPPSPPQPPVDQKRVEHILQTHTMMQENTTLAQMLCTNDREIQPPSKEALAPITATLQLLSTARQETQAAVNTAKNADISGQKPILQSEGLGR